MNEQLICLVVVFVIGMIVLGILISRSQEATPYSQTVNTSFSREEIMGLVNQFFPKGIVSGALGWKLSWTTPDNLQITGHYLI